MASYGKRPIWQWVLIYLVIGGVIYGLIYYFVIAKNNAGSYGSSSNSAPATQNTSPY